MEQGIFAARSLTLAPFTRGFLRRFIVLYSTAPSRPFQSPFSSPVSHVYYYPSFGSASVRFIAHG